MWIDSFIDDQIDTEDPLPYEETIEPEENKDDIQNEFMCQLLANASKNAQPQVFHYPLVEDHPVLGQPGNDDHPLWTVDCRVC